MAKAKSNPSVELTVDQRVAQLETLIKQALSATNLGLQVKLVGPWSGSPEIKGVLTYVDLLAVKKTQDGEGKAE